MNVLYYILTLYTIGTSSAGETRTWDGDAGDHLWSTPTNWDNDLVPEFDADVIIALDDTVLIASGTVIVESVTLSNGADLIIASGTTLETSGGGPNGSDGFHLDGVQDTSATLAILGTLNIDQDMSGSGDGIDISSYCQVFIGPSGQLNVANTAGDGIEVGHQLYNLGTISISNTTGNGVNVSGAQDGAGAIFDNTASGIVSIANTMENGIRLTANFEMINNGEITVYNATEDAFTSSSSKFTNMVPWKQVGGSKQPISSTVKVVSSPSTTPTEPSPSTSQPIIKR